MAAPNQPDDDEKVAEAREVLAGYAVGGTIKVYYDPSEPSVARFTAQEPAIEFRLDMMFTAIYLVGGAAFVWSARKLLTRRPLAAKADRTDR